MLCTSLYLGILGLGYARYEFSGCDMSAMDAELRALLGMVGTF